jgi:hypothetical protein
MESEDAFVESECAEAGGSSLVGEVNMGFEAVSPARASVPPLEAVALGGVELIEVLEAKSRERGASYRLDDFGILGGGIFPVSDPDMAS